jgi:ribonuclease P protein subunit RPR2
MPLIAKIVSINKSVMNLVTRIFPADKKGGVNMRSSARQIARQRIEALFQKAKSVYHDDPQLSRRYVATARKIAMAAKIPLPSMYKHQVCKSCHMLLVPGDNCRVRIRQKREPHVVITCLGCGCKTRVPLKKKEGENQT